MSARLRLGREAFARQHAQAWCWASGPEVEGLICKCLRREGHGGRHAEIVAEPPGDGFAVYAVWGEDVHAAKRADGSAS